MINVENNLYMRILYSNILRLIPLKRKNNEYYQLIKETKNKNKSILFATLLLNVIPLIVTIVLDALLYTFDNAYWMFVICHIPLFVFYCINFNCFKNWEICIFVIMFMILALFLIKYWILTLIFCSIGLAFIYDIF